MKLVVLGFPSEQREQVKAALKAAGLRARRKNPKSWLGHPISEWLALDEERMRMPVAKP